VPSSYGIAQTRKREKKIRVRPIYPAAWQAGLALTRPSRAC